MHARTWFLAGAVMALGMIDAAEAACQLSNIQLEGPIEGTRTLSAWWPDSGAPAFVMTSDLGSNPQHSMLACADAECDVQSLHWLDAGATGASAPAVFADPETSQPTIVAAHSSGLMHYRCADVTCMVRQTSTLPNTDGVTLHSNVVRWGQGEWALVYVNAPASSGDLTLLHCQNADCSQHATALILDQPESPAHQIRDVQLSRTPSGALLVASLDVALANDPILRYRLSYCQTPACSQPQHRLLIEAPPTPDLDHVALAVRADGRPLLLDPRQSGPALIDCSDATCTTQPVWHPLPNEANDWYAGLVLDAHGFPVIGHIRGNEAGMLQCLDAVCQNATPHLMPLPLSSPVSGTLSQNARGDWLLSHIDREEGVAHGTRCVSTVLFAADFESAD